MSSAICMAVIVKICGVMRDAFLNRCCAAAAIKLAAAGLCGVQAAVLHEFMLL
jgi:hypothetical protein